MTSHDYFDREDAEKSCFIEIPKRLIRGKEFRGISPEAKLLYGMMLERMTEGRTDGLNRVYIYYPIEEIMRDLNCGNQKAIRLLDELEKKAGLIRRRRKGLGKPGVIYVMKITN